MIDSSKVNKKNNTKEQSSEPTNQEPVKNSDRITISDKVREYSEQRMGAKRINENHTRSTFLIDNESLEKLDDLVDYMEATNALDSEFTKGLTDTKKQSLRNFAGGFKSKFINYLIKEGLEQWAKEEGTIPSIDRARYPIKDKNGVEFYNRAFKINEKNKVTYTIQDPRGHELEYKTTDTTADKENQANKEQNNNWFENTQKLEKEDKDKKDQQIKQKKDDKECKRMRMILQELNNE